MKIIAISNKKGGVGKTTTALSVAAYLGQSGFSVLAIDMDPQGNFSQASGANRDEAGTFEFLSGRPIEKCLQKFPKYAMLAAGSRLSRAEKEFDQIGKEHLLQDALSHVTGYNYDYVILDTSPSMNLLTQNAFVAADAVVVCCQANFFALSGLDDMMSNINLVKKYFNPMLLVAGILLTRYNAKTRISAQATASFRDKAKQYGTQVFSQRIRENVTIQDAQMRQTDIFTYNPACHASQDYAAFTKELFAIVEGGNKTWPTNSPQQNSDETPLISIPQTTLTRPVRRR
ncbi:MAG: ParA family protein [Schwartzia sp.]|nr:ParA family protein [Schwartzia sp. (in: firmicutes)]